MCIRDRLVTVEADPGANNVYTYSGERMFKTTKYGTNGTYAYLVIAPTLSVEDAAAQLSITAGEAAGTVSYGGDVNGSGVVDINDAQLVYDMYNAHYASFSDVAMYKFLCADIADDLSLIHICFDNASGIRSDQRAGGGRDAV